LENLLSVLKQHLAIDWLYETAQSKVAEPVIEQLIFPSAEVLKVLTEFALIGDIAGLRQQAAILQQEEQLKPFGLKLEQLARKFQLNKIREMLVIES